MADHNRSVVLLLKSKNQDDAYEKLLRIHEYQPVFIPVLSFEFTNKQVLMERLENPEKHCGLIFTSQRAVDAVHNCVTDAQFQEKWSSSLREKWLRIPVFVTGKATAKRAREQLEYSGILGENSGNAESLAELILSTIPRNSDKALLFPCANIKKETLPKILGQEGYSLDCVTAYSTKPDPNLIESLQHFFINGDVCQPECIVFFSPSGVAFSAEALKQTFPLIHETKLVAIGRSTSQGLTDHGFLVSGVAEKPDPPSLIKVIDSCVKQQSQSTNNQVKGQDLVKSTEIY